MVLKKRISMKKYSIEVYNNKLKMWEDLVIEANSVEEVLLRLRAAMYVEENYSIVSIREVKEE
jgi:hypothetical protein